MYSQAIAPRKANSGSSIIAQFQKMGYGGSFTPHGLRSTASTILNESWVLVVIQ